MQMNLFRYGCANTLLRYVEYALRPDTVVYQWPEKFYMMSALEITEEHLECYPWTFLLLRTTAGKEYARLVTPKQKVMFPTDLLEVWLIATINGEPMLTYVDDLIEAEPVVVKKPWFTPQLCGILLLILIGCGILIPLLRKYVITKR